MRFLSIILLCFLFLSCSMKSGFNEEVYKKEHPKEEREFYTGEQE